MQVLLSFTPAPTLDMVKTNDEAQFRPPRVGKGGKFALYRLK